MKLFHFAIFALVVAVALPAFAQTKPTETDMQIFAEKVKADKKLLVAANMQLTEDEAKAFWPIYEAYQEDLKGINERLKKTILDYADAYNKGSVPDATAKKLLGQALAADDAELRLKRSYVPKLEKALPAIKVVRYIQIENKIRALVRYDLAAVIPLVR